MIVLQSKPVSEEEKRAAQKRRDELKQQRMNDPFYIKDSKVSPCPLFEIAYPPDSDACHVVLDVQTTLLNDADTADIPLQKLEAGSLPPVKIEKASKKDRDGKRKKRQYAVAKLPPP